MLIDFRQLHAELLVGRAEGSNWVFTPANPTSPRTGAFPTSHQVFSNHALQIALYIYNSMSGDQCTGVRHCLYLLFSRKVDGRYLLATDPDRIPFNLDIGVASGLYALAQGHVESYAHTVVRAGKPNKYLKGICAYRDGVRVLSLSCETVKEGRSIKVEVLLDRADSIALAAHCIGYGRLLYPWLSDVAVQSLLSESRPDFRACAEIADPHHQPAPPASMPNSSETGQALGHDQAAASRPKPTATGARKSRLSSVVWAIGNQKWDRMTLDALRRIQCIPDEALLQTMVDEANAGDFKSWDAYLI